MALFDIFKKKKGVETAPGGEDTRQEREETAREREALNAGLEKTRQGLFSRLARTVAGRSKVDEDMLDELEEILITSDVGVDTTVGIIKRIEERVARDKYMNAAELQSILREEIAALLEENDRDGFGAAPRSDEPYVIMVVGVNGVGKTTTIGKLASRLTRAGKSRHFPRCSH